MLAMILLIIALVCFIAAAANYPSGIPIGWLGAAFITLSLLIPNIH
jgi:hypothetical protein